MARVSEQLLNLDFVMSMGLPGDVPLVVDDLEAVAAMMRATRKPLLVAPKDGLAVPVMQGHGAGVRRVGLRDDLLDAVASAHARRRRPGQGHRVCRARGPAHLRLVSGVRYHRPSLGDGGRHAGQRRGALRSGPAPARAAGGPLRVRRRHRRHRHARGVRPSLRPGAVARPAARHGPGSLLRPAELQLRRHDRRQRPGRAVDRRGVRARASSARSSARRSSTTWATWRSGCSPATSRWCSETSAWAGRAPSCRKSAWTTRRSRSTRSSRRGPAAITWPPGIREPITATSGCRGSSTGHARQVGADGKVTLKQRVSARVQDLRATPAAWELDPETQATLADLVGEARRLRDQAAS